MKIYRHMYNLSFTDNPFSYFNTTLSSKQEDNHTVWEVWLTQYKEIWRELMEQESRPRWTPLQQGSHCAFLACPRYPFLIWLKNISLYIPNVKEKAKKAHIKN